jgi:hypothetical protein
MNANTKADQEHMQDMLARMDAKRKDGPEEMKEDLLARLEARIEANQAKTNTNLKEMREEIKCGQAKMRSILNAWIADMKKDRKEAVSCQVTMAACLDSKKLNPEDMKSEVEHREIPTEEVAVKSSGIMRKRHRGRHIAVGRCGEPKELTRGDYGSQRKLAAACRNVSHHAAVGWHEGNVFQKIWTTGIGCCPP